MKIEGLTATPVAVPRLPRFLPRTAKGETLVNTYVIIEVALDTGVIGVGEVTCSPRWNGEEAAGSAHLVRGVLDEVLRGGDPADWAGVAGRFDAAVRGRPFLRAGLEMACLDAVGKETGLPASVLLGGARRRELPTKLVLPARDADLVAAMAADALSLGASALKVKVGLDVAADLARIDAVRRVTGDAVPLTIDANEGWPVDRSAWLGAALDERGVAAVEQPFPRAAWAATASLGRATRASLVADEAVWDFGDLLAVAQSAAYGVVSLYPGKCGGLRRCLRLARAAVDLGLGITFGSNLELGIGAAALAQVAGAAPPVAPSVPSDVIGPLYAAHPLVTDAGFVRWDGASVPEGPGLGVELDRAALAAHRVR